jgi:hypothetical protein
MQCQLLERHCFLAVSCPLRAMAAVFSHSTPIAKARHLQKVICMKLIVMMLRRFGKKLGLGSPVVILHAVWFLIQSCSHAYHPCRQSDKTDKFTINSLHLWYCPFQWCQVIWEMSDQPSSPSKQLTASSCTGPGWQAGVTSKFAHKLCINQLRQKAVFQHSKPSEFT